MTPADRLAALWAEAEKARRRYVVWLLMQGKEGK